MIYLIDTHTLIWAITEPGKLSSKVRNILESPETHVMVSAITFWEISLKYSLRKLLLENLKPEDFPEICKEIDIEILPLNGEICATYHQLKASFHKDPFDRMLIWQAKSLKIPILSKDESIRQYEADGITVIW